MWVRTEPPLWVALEFGWNQDNKRGSIHIKHPVASRDTSRVLGARIMVWVKGAYLVGKGKNRRWAGGGGVRK